MTIKSIVTSSPVNHHRTYNFKVKDWDSELSILFATIRHFGQVTSAQDVLDAIAAREAVPENKHLLLGMQRILGN
jgi:hypothetical protein